jgi:hypothetical protein
VQRSIKEGGSRDFSTDAIKSALIADNNRRQAQRGPANKNKNEIIRSSDWFTWEGTQCHGES